MYVMLFLSISLTAVSQDKVYKFEISSLEPARAISEIESELELKIYYAPTWLDSVQIERFDFEGTLEGVLSQVFAKSKINWLVLDDKIILTYNLPIQTKLMYDTLRQAGEYVFSSEYEEGPSRDIEKKVFVIGKKSSMQVGGVSILSGFVRNEENKEPLAGAFIRSSLATATSDEDGFFSLKVKNGKELLQFQFTGMKPTTRNIVVFSDGSMNINMIPDIVVLENFVVRADADENVTGVQMGMYKLALDKLKTVPKVLGENDIIKLALTLPGVQNVGEGSAGINVRGGKADQNLIILNNAALYNPFHFFGFFSSFNTDLLASTELYKSSIPVRFGGRLSSVLDVKLIEGNKNKVAGKGGLGIVTSSLMLEIPLVKNRTSVVAGGRTTYSDWVLDLVDDENIKHSDPLFYDLSMAIDHTYGTASHLNVSGYYSYDRFRLSTDSLYSYRNYNFALNWRHNFNDKLTARFLTSSSNYQFQVDYDVLPESAFQYEFAVGDLFSQLSFDYNLNSHNVTAGLDGKLYEIDPIIRKPKTQSSEIIPDKVNGERGLEGAVFISDNFQLATLWSFYMGLRYSYFADLGPGSALVYQDDIPKTINSLTDSISYKKGEIIQNYQGSEYRFSLRYGLAKTKSIKLAYNRTRQYLHTLSNSVSISPIDVWKLSDNNIKPQIADQVSIGYFQNYKENEFETSLEVYYKYFQNLIDYKTNAVLTLNKNIERDVLQGQGVAYGIELFAKKNIGKLTGWASYTFSRTFQRFISPFEEETINRGEYFPTNFDKPHIFNFVGNYELTKRYSLSLNVNYASGRPITYPTAAYQIGGASVIHFSDRNKFRVPNYFRIDFGVNIEGTHKIKKLAHGFWSFNIYNLLGRDNPYSVYFRNSGGNIQGYRLAVLGAPIPSISYKFEF